MFVRRTSSSAAGGGTNQVSPVVASSTRADKPYKRVPPSRRPGPALPGVDVIVVYANGTGPNGETGLGVQGWNYVGSPSRLDDVAYGDALFADLEQRFCVDPEREYIVGHSDGSGFTGYYACQSTRNFAAAAMLSGTLQPATCSAERALPTIHFNGLLDQKVPYNGGFVAGTNVPVAPAEIGVRDWAEQSGCALTPSQTHPLSNLTRFRYADCPAGLEHVLYRVENGGHGWPGSPLSIFTYLGINNFSAANVPASDMILDFFAAH